MTQHIILISIISILLYYFITSTNDHNIHSTLYNENILLRRETKKLKTKIKYLERYKNDVSKTFKILDNELCLINNNINEHIKNNNIVVDNADADNDNNNGNGNDNGNQNSIFNNIFNRFLTGNEVEPENLEQQNQSEECEEEIRVSVNYMPLNSNYRQYLLNVPRQQEL